MVILLKDRQGIAITSELDLANVQSLELEKLHFAAQIDINRWLSKDPKKRSNHVSFLKGRARTETVVNYFKAFLGVDESRYLDPARHTLDLVNTVKNFVAEEAPADERDAAISRVFDYATERRGEDQSITTSAVANLVSPAEPDKFTNYLVRKEIQIPGEFKPTEQHLKRLLRFRVRTKDYYLSFRRKAVEEGRIWINNDGHLVLSEVPEDIRNQLPGG
jgi:nucleoid-associated protein